MIAGPIQGRLFGGESNKLFREVTCVQGRLSPKVNHIYPSQPPQGVSLYKCQPPQMSASWFQSRPWGGWHGLDWNHASLLKGLTPSCQPHSTFPWWLTLHPFISQCRLAPLSWHTILFKSERGFPWSDFNLDQTWCQPQFQFGPVYTFSHCDTWVV